MKLINRTEICVLLGIKKSRLSELIKNHKYLGFPEPIHIHMHHQYYDTAKVVAWDKMTDHRSIKWKPMIKPEKEKLDSFDNALAVVFITKPAISDEKISFANVIKKHLRGKGKTTVIHLKERNDIERPHSSLSREYNGSADHRLVA